MLGEQKVERKGGRGSGGPIVAPGSPHGLYTSLTWNDTRLSSETALGNKQFDTSQLVKHAMPDSCWNPQRKSSNSRSDSIVFGLLWRWQIVQFRVEYVVT
jgi:hypothetical protein